MAKVRYIEDDKKEFVKIMDMLSKRFMRWQIWQDFITMFAISISNAVDKVHAPKREELYLQIIGKYNKEEQNLFPKLAGMVISALESNKNRDYLGELYMSLELNSHWRGQFFTPYHICELMAQINMGNLDETIEEKGYVTVNDPTCGAGALLVAYANSAESYLEKSGSNINWQMHVLFTAQDIDTVVALMCYIQLSLIGCAGYIKIGNTLTEPMSSWEAQRSLTMEESQYWYTPIYFSEVWNWRRTFQMMDAILSHEIKAEAEAEVIKEKTMPLEEHEYIELKTEESGQMSFL